MKRNLQKRSMLVLASVLFALNLSAQGTYGGTQYFNFAWTSGQTGVAGPSWTSPPMGVENSTITVTAPSTDPTGRSKQGYTQALKCTGVEITQLSSLGYVGFAVQNGSGSAAANFQIQIWDGAAWVTTETITLAGNADAMLAPTSVISKSASRVRYISSNLSWFYGVKTYDHLDKANAGNAPSLLSVSPVENSNLPTNGSIKLQFDELVKVGTGAITLGNATISLVQYLGNTVVVNYTGLTDMTNPLTVPASSVTDYSSTAIPTDIVKTYAIDVTPPVYQSVLPLAESTIHINDLGQEARKIKLTFDEDIALGTGTITFNGATVTTSVSGKVLTISYGGLPYDAFDTLTVPATFIEDISGNQLVSDVIIPYVTGPRDATAPVLNFQSIENGTDNKPIGGSIYFTFDEIVVPTTTAVLLNGTPAYISNNGNVIGLNYTNLPYTSTVTVTLPAGCVTDTCGNAYAGTSFSFATVSKVDKAFDIIVDVNGSGDYTTIQEAITAANGTTRTLIYVKKGVYNEKLTVAKNFISLIGEDVANTIITWNECSSIATPTPGTDNSYSMLVSGADFYMENITVRNDYDYLNGGHAEKQSVAMEHKGDKHVLKNCAFYSFQDTYYPKTIDTRQYLLNCYIQGGTDFIFGSGTCFIENATVKCVKGGQYITAASDTQKEFGLVLNNCKFSFADTIMGGATTFYLGRPWKRPAKTSYINGVFESGLIRSEGWSVWSSDPLNHPAAVYNEYNSTLEGGALMNIASRVSWSKQLTANQASRYNPDNAFNFGTTGGTWNPIPYVTAPNTPNVLSVSTLGEVNWSAVDFAVGYLIFQNDSLVGNATTTSFTTATAPSVIDVFSVAAYNEYGALSLKSASVLVGIKEANIKTGFLVSTLVNNEINLVNPSDFVSVEVFSISGNTVLSAEVDGASLNISNLQAGCYLVKGIAESGDVYLDKIIKR